MRFVPAGDPPHREPPRADAELRLEFVREATGDQPGFVVDEREVRRQGPSYTVLTLAELRAEFPRRPLCLCVGMDAFLGLPQWHRWQELIGLAHIVVAHRPGSLRRRRAVRSARCWPTQATEARDGLARGAGRPHLYPRGHATRNLVVPTCASCSPQGSDPRYLVPDAVCARMRETGCYLSSPQPTR